MNKYESVLITRQDYSSAQVDALSEKITGLVTENGGSVFKTEYWGLRNLAYRVKKNRKGHYILFDIECDKELISEYDRQMGLNEDVLRHIIVRVEEFEEGQSAILAKPAREERGGGRGNRSGPRPRRD